MHLRTTPATTDLPLGCIMTLKDVVDTINNGKNVKSKERGYIQHSKALIVIEKLTETPSFGGVEKLSTPTFNPDGSMNKTVETYALTKKQAIASAAKLDNSMLMKVIDRVEELESAKPEVPDTYIAALEALLASEKAKQLALEKIKRDKPKVAFASQVETSINSMSIGTYAKAISEEHGIKVGQNKLFKYFRERGILIKSGRRKNDPIQKYIDKEFFEVKVSTVETQFGTREVTTTLISGKGQVALLKGILAHFRGSSNRLF